MTNPSAPYADKMDYAKIVASIKAMGDAGRKLASSGLSRRAVLVLLRDATGQPMTVIESILDALPKLPEWALRDFAGGKAKI